MSDTPTALLSDERLAEIRKPYDQWLLDEASWYEISYRTTSTYLDALSGTAKLVALDRQDLWQHVDAQRHFHAKRDYAIQQAHNAYRQQVAEALKSLLPAESTLNSDCADDWEMGQAHAASGYRAQVRAAAASLGIELTK